MCVSLLFGACEQTQDALRLGQGPLLCYCVHSSIGVCRLLVKHGMMFRVSASVHVNISMLRLHELDIILTQPSFLFLLLAIPEVIFLVSMMPSFCSSSSG